ncbi:MAG: S8 family serine peptidase, partial [Verrucomicrobiales bacterium]|nr:S8 family serine peptidase [Verrucomicrobiales bacterium]
MRLRSRTWLLISMLSLVGAMIFWRLGEQRSANRTGDANPGTVTTPATVAPAAPAPAPSASSPTALLSEPAAAPAIPAAIRKSLGLATNAPVAASRQADRWRLRNTDRPLTELSRDDRALILRNALIDTAVGTLLPIPEHLRADVEPGGFIVQASGGLSPEVRAGIESRGATVVSYLPRNAFLVRATAEQAANLRSVTGVNAVLAYEPYFKLEPALLSRAVEQQPLDAGTRLNVTLFAELRDAAVARLAELGGAVVNEFRTPFGPTVVIEPPANSLALVAKVPGVQGVEIHRRRQLLNDLTRARLGVSGGTNSPGSFTNHLGLTGTNVLVNVNDTGIDATHPDLAGRVTADAPTTLIDLDGHGTHVSVTIAGSGLMSSTVTKAPGSSLPGADFRGMAPEARLFGIPLDLNTGPFLSDAYMHETTATTNYLVLSRTNLPISNNSWGYTRSTEYDASSASFDEAVRDALPGTSGDQPILYVFAAGNEGFGNDDGLGGVFSSLRSPGTAKNVITVGALDSPRNITNEVMYRIAPGIDVFETNAVFLGSTDTDFQVTEFSSRGNVDPSVEGLTGRFKPDVVAPGSFIASGRSKDWEDPCCDVPPQNYLTVLKQLNDGLGPYYRYESGTSMAAPAVTGLLALFQDYFQREGRRTSPALLKALLINGARSVGPPYNLNVADVINFQGWGLANLTNALPATEISMASPTGAVHAVQYFDATGTNAVITGESRSWRIAVAPEATDQILRVTLVWTDPPGNPGAGIKLVNDLDLFVRDEVTTNYYGGNDIPFRSDFNTPRATEDAVVTDLLNNVENILLRPPLGTNYLVTVRGSHVNVNAVSTHRDGIAQDFALVVSLENNALTNTVRVTESTNAAVVLSSIPPVTLTNGIPTEIKRAGAQPERFGTALGLTNQWRLFAFTNVTTEESRALGLTNGAYLSAVTFGAANLSLPRVYGPDIDLFVSTDPALTNLTPAAISAATKSVGRGGTEVVALTNAVLGSVYYVAVKCEDQMAGEFLLAVTSSDVPFDEDDENGNRIVRGRPFIMPIPDGSSDRPSAGYIFGIVTKQFEVRQVLVTNVVTFESTGDIQSNLSHEDAFVVLNNHPLDPNGLGGRYEVVFDDSRSGQSGGGGGLLSRPTDGPGSLNDFVGMEALGLWLLSVTDNAITQTATNRLFSLLISPTAGEGDYTTVTIPPGGSEGPVPVQVPVGATNLTIYLTNMTPSSELFVAIQYGQAPTLSSFQKGAWIQAPGGTLSLGLRDINPLRPGRYYYTLFNISGAEVTVSYTHLVEGDFVASFDRSFASDLPTVVVDDARRESTIRVPDVAELLEMRLGLRVDHPRVSDLRFHITSPQGTRLLVAENRGGSNGVAYGATTSLRKIYTTFTDETNLTSTPIKFGLAPFTNSAVVSTASNRIVFQNGFEEATAGVYGIGQAILPGWQVTQGSVSIIRAGVGSTNTVEGLQYALLSSQTSSSFATNALLSRGQYYRLRFYVGRTLSAAQQGIFVYVNGVLGTELRGDTLGSGWYRDSYLFRASDDRVRIEFRSPPSSTGRAPLAIDDVLLEEEDPAYNAYYHPEEPFKPLRGEDVLGDWTLSIEDTRAGPAGSINQGEVNWRMEFLYAPPDFDAVRLTNNIPHFDSVSGTDLKYFYIDVPRCATRAETVIAGNYATLLIFGDHDGLPFGSLDPFVDDYGPYLNLEAGGLAGFVITTNFPAPAPLRPGQRLYYAVRNYPADLTNNTFGIRVRFDCEDPPLPTVTALTNGVPTFASIEPGPGMHFYQFIVSSNSIRADFELTPITGNVDMFVRYGRVDDYPLPTPSLWDYKGDDPDPAVIDFVSVDRTSPPMPLTPGVWYVAVRNTESFPVQYSLLATEFGVGIVNLTNAVPFISTIKPVDPAVGLTGTNLQYYAFQVSSNSVLAEFETYNATGDVNLYVRKGLPIPTPFDFHFAGLGLGTAAEFIPVANTNTPIWLSPGWWFLAVENADLADVTYTIRVTEYPAVITPLSNDVPWTNSVPAGPGLDYYSFRVSPAALSATFEVYDMSSDVQMLLRPGLPVPTFNDFAYASTNAGLAPEFIELTPYSFPTPLTPGDWYLTVVNPNATPATYTVKATQVTATVIPLTNSIPYNGSLAVGPVVDYYQFQVSSNATAAEFRVTTAGAGDVDLFVRKGPPLPDALNAHFTSATPGVADEVIRIETNTVPIPLSPGLWYLTVTNASATPVSYEITATEFGVEPPPVSGLITNIVITDTNTCITWVSIPGTNYTVFAKTNALAAVWTPVSPTLVAVGTSTTYCLTPPGPWRFFDVREGESPVLPIPDPVPVLSLVDTNICVSFASVATTNYYVQGKKLFSDTTWTTLTPSVPGGDPSTTVCYPVAWGYRFFRVGVGAIVPPAPEALPGEVVRIEITVDSICLAWPTVDGLEYLVEGRRQLTDL